MTGHLLPDREKAWLTDSIGMPKFFDFWTGVCRSSGRRAPPADPSTLKIILGRGCSNSSPRHTPPPPRKSPSCPNLRGKVSSLCGANSCKKLPLMPKCYNFGRPGPFSSDLGCKVLSRAAPKICKKSKRSHSINLAFTKKGCQLVKGFFNMCNICGKKI